MAGNLLFSTTAELIRVPPGSIVYISANGNYSSIKLANGEEFVLTLQLGQMEKRISGMVTPDDNRFIRIGKSLIVNHDFLIFINPARQKLVLSDCRSFRYELSASREALKALKEFIEQEESEL